MKIMLKVQNVTKKYGKTVANNNVSFQVREGETAVLLGPNGAGKSTVIKCIAGLLRFDGNIEIGGFPSKSPDAKRLLGYIPEMPALYDMLTVNEHMEFIRRAYRLADDGFDARLLERFELADKGKKLAKELSKGMLQKLSICCALLHRPQVVVFDEPLVGLDPHAIKELKDMFGEFKAEGRSVLISTHMIDSVESYWDVGHIMMDGCLRASTFRNGSDNSNLEELFFQITESDREAK